nr:golgi-associated plant pathopathogenesis-related protein 1 [Dugesia japonica]
MTEELQFNKEGLDTHNKLRKLHNVPQMIINNSLSSESQEWSKQMAENCKLLHSKTDGKYGENIAASSKKLTGEEVTLMWYREVFDYKFNEEKQDISKIGHFSQVVWKNSNEIGLGLAKGTNGMWFYCARYLKSGNCTGKYLENINNYSSDWKDHPLIKNLSPKRNSSVDTQKSEEFNETKLVTSLKTTTIIDGVETTKITKSFAKKL